MPDAHANLAISTVATAPSPATSGTSLVVTAGQGARFPAVPFNATVWPGDALPSPTNAEIVRVTARSTDTLTLTRTQEGTSARTIVVGDVIVASITAKTLTDIESPTSTFTVQPATDTVALVAKQSAAGTTSDLMKWQNSSAGELASVNGLGQFIEGGRRLAFLTSRLTSAGTNSTVTYTASGLSVTLGANKVYRFRAQGIYRSAATTTGYGLRINFSGTTTSVQYSTAIYGTTSASTAILTVHLSNQGANLTTASLAANTDYFWAIEGLIVVGASGGNLVVEHASEVAASQVTMGVNSLLEAREVA